MSEAVFNKVPLAATCRLITDGSHFSPTPQEEGFPIVNAKDIPSGRVDLETCTRISKREWLLLKSQNCAPNPGDVLLSKDGTIGRVVHYKEDLGVVLLSSVAIIRPDESLDPGFLAQTLRSHIFDQQVFSLQSGSALRRLILADIKKIKVPRPSLPTQRRIAEILSTLDVAIEQTEALIAKMQQVKAGLMHDLFTRGVTTDGRLRPTREQASELYKESPLGWIPKEWEVDPLGKLAEIVSGVTLGSKNENTDEVGVPYLRVANVQDGYFDLQEIKTIRVSRAQFEKLQLRYGDVLMNEGGDFDKLGRGAVWQEEIKPCIHQNHVFRVRPRSERLGSFYLAFWSQSEMGKKYFVLNSKQSTNLASINSTQLNRFPVALPSLREQVRIESRVLAFNGDVESLKQGLAKLSQQKKGLMHDLLTGRVRVPSTASDRSVRSD
jgi:type I restriction enzyme S subunit